MGCFTSRIAGEDFTTINADMTGSPVHRHKSHHEVEHYETADEHERDLERVKSSQQERRASRPAYVDPDDLPMPPKTTHQHYHRRTTEMEEAHRQQAVAAGWKNRVKKVVMTPNEQRAMAGHSAGGTREEVAAARGYPERGSRGSFVPGMRRESTRSQTQDRRVF